MWSRKEPFSTGRAIFHRYAQNLAGLPLTFQPEQTQTVTNRWLTALVLDRDCALTPTQLLEHLKAEGIEGRHLWKPMHAQPLFSGSPCVTTGEENVSDDLFARGVCLPSDTKMTMEDVDRVCRAIRKVLE